MAHAVTCEDLLTRVQQLAPVLRAHADQREHARHLLEPVVEALQDAGLYPMLVPRTLLATNKSEKWFFIYGFAKNERDNIDQHELRALKAFAKELLVLDEEKLRTATLAGQLKEITYGKVTHTERGARGRKGPA